MSGIGTDDSRRASATAMGAAAFRAAHLVLDDDPKILDDPFALPFSGAGREVSPCDHASTVLAKFIGRLGPQIGPRIFRYLRALMTMRSRYAEDEFTSGIERGLSRYVILGAGLDSFAYRRPDLADRVQVVEVDHLASQIWKKRRLFELGLQQPSNLIFVPLDLSEQTLLNGFRAGGYALEEPAFLSWLGVTQYLAEGAVFRVLQEVAGLPPGTEIVFTYIAPEDSLDDENRELFKIFSQSTAARGEPWMTFFEPGRLTRTLQELGFGKMKNLTPEEANARYFAGRSDKLCLPNLEHLMRARVGYL